MPRDSQRSKVYAFETDMFDIINNGSPLSVWERKEANRSLDLEECKLLVEQIYGAYKIPAPAMMFRSGRGGACYYTSKHRINFGEWGMTPWVMVHESAHGFITQTQYSRGRLFAAHGPEFFHIYCELIERFIGGDSKTIREHALRKRIRTFPGVRYIFPKSDMPIAACRRE